MVASGANALAHRAGGLAAKGFARGDAMGKAVGQAGKAVGQAAKTVAKNPGTATAVAGGTGAGLLALKAMGKKKEQ